MNVEFQDSENHDNPDNGHVFSDPAAMLRVLESLRSVEPPVVCELTGDNGYSLTVGVGRDYGCVQHSPSDGDLPYLMAISPRGHHEEMEFLLGGTPTPIDGKYRISFNELAEIVATFVSTGERSDKFEWTEFE